MIDGRAPVEMFDEIDSTILEARRRAERGELGPVWLLAQRQAAGRGRRGRAWLSVDGNLHATYLFATKTAPADIALLGFATGVAIAETLDAMIGAGRATLKWPNDVMLGDAKVAGILIDSGKSADAQTWVALAFGINLAVAPKAIDQRTTSLREVLPPDAPCPPPQSFFASLRPKLEAWARRLSEEGFEPVRRAWLGRGHGLGAEIRVQQGEQSLSGRLAGLSARGELELETSDGRRLVAAGDVFLLNAA